MIRLLVVCLSVAALSGCALFASPTPRSNVEIVRGGGGDPGDGGLSNA